MMNATSFAERKIYAAQQLLNIDNEELLEQIEHLFVVFPEHTGVPCAYTSEEIEARLAVTSRRAVKGQGITSEQLAKNLERWAS